MEFSQQFHISVKVSSASSVYLPDPVNIESDENKNLRRYAALLRINLRFSWVEMTIASLQLYGKQV